MIRISRPVQPVPTNPSSYCATITATPGGTTPTAKLKVGAGAESALAVTVQNANEGEWRVCFSLPAGTTEAEITVSQGASIAIIRF